jgi:hypothetical protein
VSRVCVLYAADAAPYAEELVAALGAERTRRGPPEPGDIIVVLIAREPPPRADVACARGDTVIGIRVVGTDDPSPPPATATSWYLRADDRELEIAAIARRLARLLEAGPPPPPVEAPDLSALLELEARGAVRRRRAAALAPVGVGVGAAAGTRSDPLVGGPVVAPTAHTGRLLLRRRRAVADVTVFSPQRVCAGDTFLVQVFVHPPARAGDARGLAMEFDTATARRGVASLAVPLARGAELTLELAAPGLLVEESVRQVRWRGRLESVQFGVTVAADADAGSRVATLLLSHDSVPAGQVKFVLGVAPGPRSAATPAGDEARAYQRAFVSYAREDYGEVLRRVQVLRNARLSRLEVFQDILDIDPGERWGRRLYLEIDRSDVLLLFWSAAAHASEWVRREVRYALDRRVTEFDRPEIVPVIIESPPHPPWPELTGQHFDDVVARLIG